MRFVRQAVVLFLSVFPLFSSGFSETEIDSLESGGTKSFSPSPWRTQFSFSLQRNLEVNSRLLFDIGKDTSLLDLSNLFYTLGANINYSLGSLPKHSPDWLKNTELFLNVSFNSPFKGYSNNLKNYSAKDYIQFGLGDIVGGAAFPAYKTKNLISYLSFSSVVFPFSRFSKNAGLSTTLDGTLNVLYFLKKEEGWNLALSAGQNIAYSRYNKASADKAGYVRNIPFDTSQNLSLIYRQNQRRQMPSSLSFSITHYFGINTIKTRVHDLTLGLASAWRVRKRFYVNFSIRWRDRISVYNPSNPEVKKKEPVRFNLSRTFFRLGGSYSF